MAWSLLLLPAWVYVTFFRIHKGRFKKLGKLMMVHTYWPFLMPDLVLGSESMLDFISIDQLSQGHWVDWE